MGFDCLVSSFQTLYTYPENWRAFKAQIAAQYSGARLKVASNSPAFTFGQTNRTPAFLNNFPLGKVSTTGPPVTCSHCDMLGFYQFDRTAV